MEIDALESKNYTVEHKDGLIGQHVSEQLAGRTIKEVGQIVSNQKLQNELEVNKA